MILKGSQREGARQLATHLMNMQDNDHVSMPELRGFVSSDLHGAMAETEAVARGTKCRQSVFSLSLNPPKEADVGVDGFIAAADKAEERLGLTGQPRAVVIHEKNGRKHAHVVWSRIDPGFMTAVNLPFYKTKLAALSKELFLENGWELPEGHKANGWKNPLNYTLAEWQQAKRLDMDPREFKQMVQSAWQASDSLPSFRNALDEHGLYLAKGDRRGFVAVDLNGEVFSLSRNAGVKPKDMEQRLGKPDALPSVADVQADLRQRVRQQLRDFIAQDRAEKGAELKPLTDQARDMALAQRAERTSLQKKQDQRWKEEGRDRASRLRRGLGVILDVVSGRLFAVRRENEREASKNLLRDKTQREQLGSAQLKERAALQKQIDALKSRHQKQRMILARQVADALRRPQQPSRRPNQQRQRNGPDLEM